MVYQGNNIANDPAQIKYKSSLKKEDLNKTILDSNDFLLKKKISCPKFSGTGGIEDLLWLEESFQNISKQFKWDIDKTLLFDNFNLVVEEGTADHWERILKEKNLTIQEVNACMDQFYLIYSSLKAKNIMYQYLASSEYTPLKKVKVIDHKCQMETLFRYTDRLSGMEPIMTKNMKKKTLIQSFYPTHVLAYKKVGNKIDVNTSVDNVMEFMKLQK